MQAGTRSWGPKQSSFGMPNNRRPCRATIGWRFFSPKMLVRFFFLLFCSLENSLLFSLLSVMPKRLIIDSNRKNRVRLRLRLHPNLDSYVHFDKHRDGVVPRNIPQGFHSGTYYSNSHTHTQTEDPRMPGPIDRAWAIMRKKKHDGAFSVPGPLGYRRSHPIEFFGGLFLQWSLTAPGHASGRRYGFA